MGKKEIDETSNFFPYAIIFAVGMVVGILILLFVQSKSIPDEGKVAMMIESDENCNFQEGNLTIQGCHAVDKYVSNMVDISQEEYKKDRWRFEVDCYMYYDEPIVEGQRVEMEMTCTPRDW